MIEGPRAFYTDSQGTPEVAHLRHGSVAMFSARSPDKMTVNEDAYAVVPVDGKTVVLAVADGAGGHVNGDAASRLAIDSLIVEIQHGVELAPRVAILNGFEVGQDMITGQFPGAATTLVVVEITGRTARTYHVGDSGASVIGGRGKLKFQTVFHSPTGYAVEAGLLSEAEAMRHAARHVVSNLLGIETMSVDVGTPLNLSARDTIVIASDGLYDNLSSSEIAALACRGDLESACRSLVGAATDRMLEPAADQPSKPDDLTVLVYRRGR